MLPQTAPVALLQFWKKYDKTLSDFMRNGMGISLDLTAVSPERRFAGDTPSLVSACLLLDSCQSREFQGALFWVNYMLHQLCDSILQGHKFGKLEANSEAKPAVLALLRSLCGMLGLSSMCSSLRSLGVCNRIWSRRVTPQSKSRWSGTLAQLWMQMELHIWTRALFYPCPGKRLSH